jgi:hypothetical protein
MVVTGVKLALLPAPRALMCVTLLLSNTQERVIGFVVTDRRCYLMMWRGDCGLDSIRWTTLQLSPGPRCAGLEGFLQPICVLRFAGRSPCMVSCLAVGY